MKIAVQEPYFIFGDQEKNFNGYNYEFVERYCDYIYVKSLRDFIAFKRFFLKNRVKKKVVYSISKLNKNADVILCFNGEPYKSAIPQSFKGLKIFHMLDFVFYASKSASSLKQSGVDYLLGYCRHDVYSDFYKKYYSDYINRVIPVPFGYSARFVCKIPFANRINKAIALGSVNPVDDPLCEKGMLDEYVEFYKDYKFTHYLRRTIVEERSRWKEQIDDLLPTWPETKNFDYDAVEMLNEYTMFINDVGIMKFPPARTYEGIACGAVMVAENLAMFADLGFADGENCILFSPGDYENMIEKVSYYQSHLSELENMQKNSLELSKKFCHQNVANKLYEDISNIYKGLQ